MNDTFQITTPTDLDIQMSRVFDAPREAVFDAHTKPEYVQQWLLGPGPNGWVQGAHPEHRGLRLLR